MNLFQLGNFTLASGRTSNWKIECDALTDDDLKCIAHLISQRVPPFRAVEGVPTGGLKLASFMENYIVQNDLAPILIVDDVYTSGGSMIAQRGKRLDVVGAVIFARYETIPWVKPLFVMTY